MTLGARNSTPAEGASVELSLPLGLVVDVVGLFKPQKHEKHKKVRATSVDALSSVSRFSRRCQVQLPETLDSIT